MVTGRGQTGRRRRVMTPTVVCQLAEKHNLPVLTPTSLKDRR